MPPGSKYSVSLAPAPPTERRSGGFDAGGDLSYMRRKKKNPRTMRACDLCRLKKAKFNHSATETHHVKVAPDGELRVRTPMCGGTPVRIPYWRRQQATLIEAIQILHHRLRTGEAMDDPAALSMKEDQPVNDILKHLGLTPLELSEAVNEHVGRYSQSIVSPASSSTSTPASAEDCPTQGQLDWGDYQVPLRSPDKMVDVETPAKHSRDHSAGGAEPSAMNDSFNCGFWESDGGLEAQNFFEPSPSPTPGDTFSDAQLGWDFAETCPLSYLAPAGKSGPHQSFRLVF
ncbi:uncharacterized protein Z520_12365 [Fonsecaea multimorphosa CBS 102226]|uniref:Uncharacterized protein n=1 Tax=Fonsecaea multimorphosa CBS 102226 TaxID=1442371 RepID=A0A0D2JN90_9EURO|nr:uncharacterized protein Z520_12365 [Fonsecaea multimorphosa CBS 102226]KIX91929.1 hypothetical protein Z520_12365 [Fonsecaea multimorphosa CBS 102226]